MRSTPTIAAIAVGMMVVLSFLPSMVVAAEDFNGLWGVDFCTAEIPEWTRYSGAGPHNFVNNQFFVGGGCSLQAQDGTSLWRGPTYRSAPGSIWNPLANQIIKIEIDRLSIRPDTADTANRQLMLRIDSNHEAPTSPASSVGDYMSFSIVRSPCCLATPFLQVYVEDDSLPFHLTQYPFSSFANWPNGVTLSANLTINTQAGQWWFNWSMSVNGDSGSITDVWANDIDGPFAESPDQFINIWTLSSSSNNGVANILNGLFVSVASVMPRLPPGGLSAQVRPDFLYSYTNFGVQFQDRTSAPGAIESYIWVFDDGYGSKRPSPLHLYPCAGRYLVTLYVRDEFQNRDDVSKIVLVNESTPLCGILAMPRPEAPINTTTQWLTIYEVFFVFLVFFSGASLLMGWDFPLLNKRVRWFLLWLSLALLSISFLLR